jgi:hypothetical protein
MKNKLKTVWLPVNISSGMFSNEFAVEITQNNGECISFFADGDLIKQKGNKQYLKVYEVGEENQGKKTILLPSEAFETASRWIEITTNGERYDFE